MEKRIGKIKLKIVSGKANPSPPIGPSLGQKGLNIMEFCKKFNEKTKSIKPEILLNVLIIIYSNKNYDIIIKNPSTIYYLKKKLNIENFSNETKNYINFINLKEIILNKIKDFNTLNFSSIYKTILGTLKSTGSVTLLND